MANHRITPDVREVLERSTITECSLVLPQQLSRELYLKVNAVLVNAGGKWNRREKAHIFSGDPLEKLGIALETGVSVDDKQRLQAFYTPRYVADQLAIMADVSGRVVLEPSAGGGALVDACMRCGARSVRCIEIDSTAASQLASRGFNVTCADFLQQRPSTRFTRIVMNPPFTRNQDVAHVRHAYDWLTPGGILVALIAGNKQRRPLVAFLESVDDWKMDDLPAGAFKEAGTLVSVCSLVIRRHAALADIKAKAKE